MEKLLVVVDMQNDFVTGSLGSGAARAIVPNVCAKVDAALKSGTTVYLTMDTHDSYYADYTGTVEGKKLPISHCVKDTAGWELIPELKDIFTANSKAADAVFNKNTFGSLKLANAVCDKYFDEIEVIGLVSNICVVSNVLLIKAAKPNARIIFDASCSAGTTQEAHNAAVEVMKSCHIDVINAEVDENA